MAESIISQLSFLVLDQSGKDSGKTAEIQWLGLDEIVPHPDNPRLFMRDEVVSAIASSVKEKGFDPCYAVLVRPLDGKYQMISGHHRLEGCKQAEIAKIAAWVREMSDEEAFLELVRGNNQGELKPLEIGLHALKYVEKGSKWDENNKGIKGYALEIGKSDSSVGEYRKAADVFHQIRTCGFDISQLTDKHKTLYHISKAPESEWGWLVEQLLANSWSVKETEAAVKAVRSVSLIPAELKSWLNPDEYRKKAIADDQTADNLQKWVDCYRSHLDELLNRHGETRSTFEIVDDRAIPLDINIKDGFHSYLFKIKNPSNKLIGDARFKFESEIDNYNDEYSKWKARKESDEERLRQEREAERKAREEKLKYYPEGINADVREINIEENSIDLCLIDPPYLLSNDGITCRGNKQTTVNKNFEDDADTAISPDDWMPIAFNALKPGGLLVLTLTWHIADLVLASSEDAGFEPLEDLYWIKKSAPPRLTPTGHRAIVEPIYVFKKPGGKHTFNYEWLKDYCNGVQPSNVLNFEQCSGNERLGWHDTQKPLALWNYLINAYSAEGSKILDLFAGTATTAVAGMSKKRKVIWIEKKEDFFMKAQDRIDEVFNAI